MWLVPVFEHVVLFLNFLHSKDNLNLKICNEHIHMYRIHTRTHTNTHTHKHTHIHNTHIIMNFSHNKETAKAMLVKGQ